MSMQTMDVTPQTDEELAARSADSGPGADEALGELLTRHGRRLHRFFAMQFRDGELVRDLVQGVFERAIQARGRLPRDQGFRPWLWTIAINLAHNTRRQQRVRQGAVSLDATGDSSEIPLRDRIASPAESPRGRAIRSERTALLLRAVEELPSSLRDVIHLKHFQGLPCSDVAVILGVSEGTVWSRMHRALDRLRAMLSDDLRVEGGDGE
ncbi:sigma-70 family RNA polymerase sigma factor [Candidatus Sumerlaeota bacterium]|nr:sigma-70 family RNA polymerase sigma factor [Candidatus Sumerlaeota bacterium]